MPATFSDAKGAAGGTQTDCPAPDTIEPVQQKLMDGSVRLGDLMKEVKGCLANLYVGQPQGGQAIATLQVRYDDPALNQTGLLTETIPVEANVCCSKPLPTAGTHPGVGEVPPNSAGGGKVATRRSHWAATMLQTAAKTALQMGDKGAATVLQSDPPPIREDLTDADRKKTRIVSKTVLQ